MCIGLYSHISVFVLPVGLSVVTNNPVSIGSGSTLSVRRSNLSVKRVVESLEETLTQVHITNRVYGSSEVNRAGDLAIAAAPVMLNTLEMPLVNKHNNFLGGVLINLSEKILITLVHKDLLKSREEDLCSLSVPVDQVLIKALLGEGLRCGLSDLLAVRSEFLCVEGLSVLDALEDVVGHIHAGLVVETIGCLRIQFSSEELDIGSNLFSCFTSILDFKAREPEFEVEAKAVVESEGGPVCCESREENELPNTPIILEPVLATLC